MENRKNIQELLDNRMKTLIVEYSETNRIADIPILLEQCPHLIAIQEAETAEHIVLRKHMVQQEVDIQIVELFLECCDRGDKKNIVPKMLEIYPQLSEKYIALAYLIASVNQFTIICETLSPRISMSHYKLIVDMIIEHIDHIKWHSFSMSYSSRPSYKRIKGMDDIVSHYIYIIFENERITNTIAFIDTIYVSHKELFDIDKFYVCVCDEANCGIAISLFRNVIFQMISQNTFPQGVLNNPFLFEHACQYNLLDLLKLLHTKQPQFNMDYHNIILRMTHHWFTHENRIQIETFQWIYEHYLEKVFDHESEEKGERLLGIICTDIIESNRSEYIDILQYLLDNIDPEHSQIRKLFILAVGRWNMPATILLFEHYYPDVKGMIVDEYESDDHDHDLQVNGLFIKQASLIGFNCNEKYDNEILEMIFIDIDTILKWLTEKVNSCDDLHECMKLQYHYNLKKDNQTLCCEYSITHTLKMEQQPYEPMATDPPLEA